MLNTKTTKYRYKIKYKKKKKHAYKILCTGQFTFMLSSVQSIKHYPGFNPNFRVRVIVVKPVGYNNLLDISKYCQKLNQKYFVIYL